MVMVMMTTTRIIIFIIIVVVVVVVVIIINRVIISLVEFWSTSNNLEANFLHFYRPTSTHITTTTIIITITIIIIIIIVVVITVIVITIVITTLPREQRKQTGRCTTHDTAGQDGQRTIMRSVRVGLKVSHECVPWHSFNISHSSLLWTYLSTATKSHI